MDLVFLQTSLYRLLCIEIELKSLTNWVIHGKELFLKNETGSDNSQTNAKTIPKKQVFMYMLKID